MQIKARAVAVVQLLFSHGPWDAPKGSEEITIGAAKADTQEVVDIDVGANGFKTAVPMIPRGAGSPKPSCRGYHAKAKDSLAEIRV